MDKILNAYTIREESLLKVCCLCRGVEMSDAVLSMAASGNAKTQNMVYNMPLGASASRPQELLVRNLIDGYETVVSCVAPAKSNPVQLVCDGNGKIFAKVDGVLISNLEIQFVPQPEYYSQKIGKGYYVRDFVSACGLDELNIIPWKGCSISGCCLFCGVNNFITPAGWTSHLLSRKRQIWVEQKDLYLECLKEAVAKALQSDCYQEHAHAILIAGNLENDALDFETEIFSEIARELKPALDGRCMEGLVAVMTPPADMALLSCLREAGIAKVVFNLEAVTREGFARYCPGKNKLGYDFFYERLLGAVSVFGRGNVWSNLVFGLEKAKNMEGPCRSLVDKGIVVGANVLHLDKGNRLDCEVPEIEETLDFYCMLNRLNSSAGFSPYYCSKALRTSMVNEVADKRIICKDEN